MNVWLRIWGYCIRGVNMVLDHEADRTNLLTALNLLKQNIKIEQTEELLTVALLAKRVKEASVTESKESPDALAD